MNLETIFFLISVIRFTNIKVEKSTNIITFGIPTEWMSKKCTRVYQEQQSQNIFIWITRKSVDGIVNANKLK